MGGLVGATAAATASGPCFYQRSMALQLHLAVVNVLAECTAVAHVVEHDPWIRIMDYELTAEHQMISKRFVDTSGAGDVFHGAYVHSYLAHPDLAWNDHFRFARAGPYQIMSSGGPTRKPALHWAIWQRQHVVGMLLNERLGPGCSRWLIQPHHFPSLRWNRSSPAPAR
jgi:hypothetical protein